VHGKQEEDARNNGVGGMASNHAAATYSQEGHPPAEDEVFDAVWIVEIQYRDEPPEDSPSRGVTDSGVLGAESMQVFVGAKEPSEGHETADDEEDSRKDGEDLVESVGMTQIG